MSNPVDTRCSLCRSEYRCELPADCPCCGGPLKRLWSAPRFILKGDGWAGSKVR